MRSYITCTFLLTLAACAAQEPPAKVAQADPAATVCRKETPIGSTIPRTVCQRPKTDAERANDISALRDAVQTQPGIGNGR